MEQELVELERFGDLVTAELIAAVLRGSGIRVAVFSADAGGWAPHLGGAQGNRLMVHKDDTERARLLLAADLSEPRPTHRRQRR